MAFSMMILSITIRNARSSKTLLSIRLGVVMLRVRVKNTILSAIIVNVIMLSVVAPKFWSLHLRSLGCSSILE
jgi:hypothetical protein